MLNKKFTFIIHGNYSTTHLNMCDELRNYGKIILSTNKKYINDISKNVHFYDKIVLESDIDTSNIYNHQNIYLHVRSVLSGLSHCDTPYVVKLRSNHCYSNIHYIVEQVLLNVSDKFLCSNITLNPKIPYHPCDNIIAGKKELIDSIYKTANNIIINNDFIYENIDSRLCSEVLLFISYLKSKNIKINGINKYDWYYVDFDRNSLTMYALIKDQYKSLIKENLQLIDVNKLKPYKIKFNSICEFETFEIKTIDDFVNITNFG